MPKGGNAPRQPLSAKRPGAAVAKRAVKQAMKQAAALGPAKTTARRNKRDGQKPSQKAPPVARAPRTKAEKQALAAVVLERLLAAYPDAHCELDHRSAFELLCATILSAQCTDARVNMVTPRLFARFPDAHALADAPLEEVAEIVRTTGFYRAKAKNLVQMAKALVRDHGGQVPRTIAELVPLAGVGRKTANVILGNAFGINEGIVVDTHVQRLSRRLGLTREPDPVGIERELMPLFPREHWAMLSHLLIWHGRRVCLARKPNCGDCVLHDVCPSAGIG
jgi:endonuclease-3